MENDKEMFDLIPEVEELINFAQFETDVEAPTKAGLTNFRMAVLWEGDEYNLFKHSGEIINPMDMQTRGRWMQLETLVQSICKIGSKDYRNDDKDKNEALKNELRVVLQRLNPHLIKFLYDTYVQLNVHSKEFIDKKTESIKKKLQTKMMKLKPL